MRYSAKKLSPLISLHIERSVRCIELTFPRVSRVWCLRSLFRLIECPGSYARKQKINFLLNTVLLMLLIFTHAGIAACVGIAFSRVCLSVCPRSNRKTAWAINTKLDTFILYSSRSACIDQRSKGQRSRSHGYENHHGRIVASDHVPYSAYQYAAVLLAAVAGVGLHVDTTAYVF